MYVWCWKGKNTEVSLIAGLDFYSQARRYFFIHSVISLELVEMTFLKFLEIKGLVHILKSA